MLLHVLPGDADGPQRLAAPSDVLGLHVLFLKLNQTFKQLIRPAGQACLAHEGGLVLAFQP